MDIDPGKQFFYSNTTKGFYNAGIHGDGIPDDAAAITEGEHSALLQGLSQGKAIAVVGGKVTLTDPPPPSLGDAKAAKLAGINAAFDDALGKGFAVSLGFSMDATLEDLQKLKTAYDFAVLMGEATMVVVDYDNVAHPNLPMADVETIMKDVGGNYRTLYMLKQQLRGQVQAATTAEMVNTVVWPAG